MSDTSYQRTIAVDAAPEAAYRALTTGYERWWTATGGNTFSEVGDQIKFTFAPLVSYWTFAATVLDPDHCVELKCIDAYHEISDKPDAPKDEWLGSRLRWSIKPNGGRTMIEFTHDGLLPLLHCYDVCQAGWDQFFVASLKSYLDTGIGTPFNESMA